MAIANPQTIDTLKQPPTEITVSLGNAAVFLNKSK
jgi:hypothetical protein